MSTKCTLKCSNKFHLYEDINFQNGELFLEIGGVTVLITKEIWNEIIKIGQRDKTIAG